MIPSPSGELVCVGKHPRVCELLAGIAKERPPKARYNETWDVSDVIGYLKSRGPNEVISLKDLSLKLTMILALTSLSRGMEIHLLSLDRMNFFNDRMEFTIDDVLKHSKQGKPNAPCVFFAFQEDIAICPKACLEAYLERTRPLRNPINQWAKTL